MDTKPSRSEEALIDMIAELRAAFLQAVPEAYHDHRFAEMMGSPYSVLEYVAKHLATQQRWEPLPDGMYEYPNWDGRGTVTIRVLSDGAELEQWHDSLPDNIDEISLSADYRLCRRQGGNDAQ